MKTIKNSNTPYVLLSEKYGINVDPDNYNLVKLINKNITESLKKDNPSNKPYEDCELGETVQEWVQIDKHLSSQSRAVMCWAEIDRKNKLSKLDSVTFKEVLEVEKEINNMIITALGSDIIPQELKKATELNHLINTTYNKIEEQRDKSNYLENEISVLINKASELSKKHMKVENLQIIK